MDANLARTLTRSRTDAEQPQLPQATLSETIARAHDAVRAGLSSPPRSARDQHYDDHDNEDAYDVEVATVSAHLGVVEAVLHPAARRWLRDRRGAVTAQRERARHIERLMRLIEGRVHGDSHAEGSDVLALQRELLERVGAQAASELDLAQRLDEVLAPAQRRAVAERFAAAMTHAPTRPHPFAPHPRGLARLVMRVCAFWDHALDEMDNRTVSDAHVSRDSRPLSLWDRYFLGIPQFAEAPSVAEPAPGIEFRRADRT